MYKTDTRLFCQNYQTAYTGPLQITFTKSLPNPVKKWQLHMVHRFFVFLISDLVSFFCKFFKILNSC